MPNHVGNKIIFYGEEKNVKNILDEIKGEKTLFDFNKLIPMPDNVFKGDLGKEEKEKYGENNWYDWSIKNWGTKWNAYDVAVDKTDEGNYVLLFNTAWSMPMPIISKLLSLCYKSNVDLMGYYSDEDFGSHNHGLYDYVDGIYNDYSPWKENEISEIYVEIWGESECFGKDENDNWVHYDCEDCPNKENC